tara:strand:+ start:4520 stop:5389 length:870 start_codon:yes stop_codon:yes gene_type:complete
MLLNNAFLRLNINQTADKNIVKEAYRKLSISNLNNNEVSNELKLAYTTIIQNIENNINTNNTNNTNNNTNNTNNTNNGNNNNTNNTNNSNNSNINNTSSNTSSKNNDFEIENLYIDDIIQYVNITYEQSFNGTTLPITINRKVYIYNRVKDETETLYFDIPCGIDNNENILLKNKGNNYNNEKYSDIKIIINLINSEKYSRTALNIIKIFDITFKESIVGIERNFEYLNKKKYKIKTKSGEIINPFTEKILPQLGFKRNEYYGDLIIKFNIIYPKQLNTETIKILNKIL